MKRKTPIPHRATSEHVYLVLVQKNGKQENSKVVSESMHCCVEDKN